MLPAFSYKATFFAGQLSENPNEIYLPKMSGETLTLAFTHQNIAHTRSSITGVFPSPDVVPSNLLKFHICFSNPMTIGEVYKRVKIIDQKNKEIEKAFLVVDQEFWDEDMKVVTLLLDPGRIKRGLKANLEMDAPLTKNNSYTLVIDKHWKDINGNFLERELRKTFHCAEADRESPSTDRWTIIAPKHAFESLIVKTNETLNMLSLANGFLVMDSQGQRVDGDVSLLKNETGISFKPKNQWNKENYVLHINPLIEDLAGNNLNRVFDRDVTTLPNVTVKTDITIPFSITLENR